MSDIEISAAHNDYRLGGTLSYLNLGTGVATIKIYGTTRPAFGASAGGSSLVDLTLADPAGAVTAHELVLDAGDDGLIMTSGEALWARILNGNGDTVLDCDVSDTAGTATVKLPDTTLYAGGVTRMVSGILR